MASDTRPSLKFKVIFVGDAGVGKTSIINAYFGRDTVTSPTVGAVMTTTTVLCEGSSVALTVWDTAGNENFRNLVPVYARGAHAAVLVLDRTSPKSYDSLAGWYSFLQEKVEGILCVLAVHKADLPAAIDVGNCMEWAAERKIQAFETSTVARQNIGELFKYVASTLACEQSVGEHPKTESVPIQPGPGAPQQSERICC